MPASVLGCTNLALRKLKLKRMSPFAGWVDLALANWAQHAGNNSIQWLGGSEGAVGIHTRLGVKELLRFFVNHMIEKRHVKSKGYDPLSHAIAA
jgi:hypothetical protein